MDILGYIFAAFLYAGVIIALAHMLFKHTDKSIDGYFDQDGNPITPDSTPTIQPLPGNVIIMRDQVCADDRVNAPAQGNDAA